jgi:hypothetical protein
LARGRDWSVVNRAKAILWIAGPIAAVVLWVVIPATIFGTTLDFNPQSVGGLLGSILGAGIWTAYLSKAKRVRNTYGGCRSQSLLSAHTCDAQMDSKSHLSQSATRDNMSVELASAARDEISLDEKTKKCPACAETIKFEAKKC